MFEFTVKQRLKALCWLSLFHIIIIAASNYLVQYPVVLFSVSTTWGAFSFPFIFLATDLTVRIFGAPLARRIIFWVMIPALIISYAFSTLFFEAQWQGWQALTSFNLSVFRIALASFSAYLFGQLMDVQVFNRLRQLKTWWIAPCASSTLGGLCDTFLFFFIAFFHSADPVMSENWYSFALVDWMSKMAICGLFFLPAYGIMLNALLKRLSSLQRSPTMSVAR